MFRGVFGRCQVAVWTTILAAATAPTFGQEGKKAQPFNMETAANQLANEILDATPTKQRLPLASDAEHARTIDPVLTRGTAIWIHEALPSPPLTVMRGSVFSYHDLTYNPLDAPVLKIRPVDDDQIVPFLVRVIIETDGDIPGDAAVVMRFPAPAIFEPRIENVEGWVGPGTASVEVERSFEDATLTVRVPLAPPCSVARPRFDNPVAVILQGELVLAPYRAIPAGRFSNAGETVDDPATAGLARLEEGRDIKGSGERDHLQLLADNLVEKPSTVFDGVVAANTWVSNRLRYQESPATRSAIEALEDRSGDCDEHGTLMVALLRAMGIPARRANGLLYNFDTLSAHAWVEVALPKRNGDLHWFLADPTLAGTTLFEEEKAGYVQFKDRILLYPMKPTVRLEGTTANRTADVFLNWREPDEQQFTEPARAESFVEIVIDSVDLEISSGANRLAEAGLLLPRESASIIGSPYLIVDRALGRGSSERIQLRLENEERLVLDVMAAGGSDFDPEIIPHFQSVYRELNSQFFAGEPAFRNLELIYIRDRHSDRLHTVSLRFGRYLVEHSLARILKRIEKSQLLTSEETARISAVAEASGGKNLYLLQELARRLPKSAEGAKDE